VKEIIQLIKIDFDNMENQDPLYERTIGIFEAYGDKTAHGMVELFFQAYGPIEIYLGWDGEVYPKFKLIKHTTWVNPHGK